MQLDPEEVKACTWLTRENIHSLYADPIEESIKIKQFLVREDGGIQPAELDIHRMFHRELWRDKNIYTGSQLVLTKWLENQHISSKI